MEELGEKKAYGEYIPRCQKVVPRGCIANIPMELRERKCKSMLVCTRWTGNIGRTWRKDHFYRVPLSSSLDKSELCSLLYIHLRRASNRCLALETQHVGTGKAWNIPLALTALLGRFQHTRREIIAGLGLFRWRPHYGRSFHRRWDSPRSLEY